MLELLGDDPLARVELGEDVVLHELILDAGCARVNERRGPSPGARHSFRDATIEWEPTTTASLPILGATREMRVRRELEVG